MVLLQSIHSYDILTLTFVFTIAACVGVFLYNWEIVVMELFVREYTAFMQLIVVKNYFLTFHTSAAEVIPLLGYRINQVPYQ